MTYRILYHHRIRADDGQAVHVRELIDALRRAGHDVHECALVRKSEANVPAAHAPTLWRHLSLPRIAVEAMEIAYGRVGARRLLRAAADFRPDFVYERHALHCDAGLRAARALRVPLLLEVNSPMCDEMERLGLLRFPRRARRTEARVLGSADAVLAVSEELRARLVALGADAARTSVVRNGVDLRRHRLPTPAERTALRRELGFPDDAFVVAFVGYMRPWHRLDLVVDAMSRDDCASVRLLLLGDGPALATTLAAASTRGVVDRVDARGVVVPDAVPRFLAAADAALIPAINGYASPLKLFDSLAASVPTIAPDQRNLRECVTDGEDAVLFARDDATALHAALRGLVLDRDRATRIGAAGRATLLRNDWTWDGNAQRVVATFERCRR